VRVEGTQPNTCAALRATWPGRSRETRTCADAVRGAEGGVQGRSALISRCMPRLCRGSGRGCPDPCPESPRSSCRSECALPGVEERCPTRAAGRGGPWLLRERFFRSHMPLRHLLKQKAAWRCGLLLVATRNPPGVVDDPNGLPMHLGLGLARPERLSRLGPGLSRRLAAAPERRNAGARRGEPGYAADGDQTRLCCLGRRQVSQA
jgi:hypothetical protein